MSQLPTDYNPQELFDKMKSSLTYKKEDNQTDHEHGVKFYAKVMEWLDENSIKPSVEAIEKNAKKIQDYLDGKTPLVIKTDNLPAPEPKKGFGSSSTKSKLLLLAIIGVVVYLIFFNKDSE